MFAERLHHTMKPLRNPVHRNYLSKSNYPIDMLPLFVAGNFIILSMDLVDFIVRNINEYLRPTGTLEDVSLAVWFQALQVSLYINKIF